MKGQAIVSVHDVTPETVERTARILGLLEECDVPPATLLVVPGREWSPEGLEVLREWVSRGHPLAGHGWIHKATNGSRTLFHRMHSLLISRNEAEHLSLPAPELATIIRSCHEWFSTVGLPTPELYVPPAWAMGSLGLQELRNLPFRWYEVLRGMVDGATGRVRWLPLVGFEADTTFRKVSLRFWNGLNAAWSRRVAGPLRISIHPYDLDLLLGEELKNMVGNPWRFVGESAVFAESGRGRRP